MKFFYSTLRNQSGSMLIQILIASVMATTMALMISTMMTDSFKGMSNVEQLQAAMDLRTNTEVLLALQNNCTRNFGPTGQNLTLGTTVLNSPLVNAAGTVVINVGSSSAPLYNKARILSYTIEQVGLPISVAPNYIVLAEMKLMLEKVGQGFGSNQVLRSVMLTAKLTGAGGTITDCVAGKSLNFTPTGVTAVSSPITCGTSSILGTGTVACPAGTVATSCGTYKDETSSEDVLMCRVDPVANSCTGYRDLNSGCDTNAVVDCYCR